MKNLGICLKQCSTSIVLLGWSPGGEEEIFTQEELITMFDVSRLSKSPAMFDKNKLTWTNNQYIKKMTLEEVIEFALPHLAKVRSNHQLR